MSLRRAAAAAVTGALAALGLVVAVFPLFSPPSPTAPQPPAPLLASPSPLPLPRPPTKGSPPSDVKLLVPWGKAKIAATTPLPVPSCMPEGGGRCIVMHREDYTDKGRALEEADVVFFDSNAKMKDDIRYYDPVANPLRKVLGFLNIENVWGRLPAWKSKWRVRWFAKANQTSWWSRFPLVASYEEGSVLNYRYWHTLDRRGFEKHANPKLSGKKLTGAAFIASNCWTRFQTTTGFDRDEWVRNFSKHFEVEPLGACGAKQKENGKVPPHVSAALYNRFGCQAAKPHQKRCIVSKYAFYAGFENSLGADYVTEKLYEPLLVGTVPVYLGAPNVEAHVPTSHCLVKVQHFPNLEVLAGYLKCLLKHPVMYEYYTAWKDREFLPSWKRRFEDPLQHPLCKACRLVAGNDPILRNEAVRLPSPSPDDPPPELTETQKPFRECLPPRYKHIGVPFPGG